MTYTLRSKQTADILLELAELHENSDLRAIAQRVKTEFADKGLEMSFKEEHAIITAAAATLRPKRDHA